MEDWRLTGQDAYMKDAVLKRVDCDDLKNKSDIWHEHCEFCMSKITNKTTVGCYSTEDEYRWVCHECYHDFHNLFNWRIKRK